MRFRRVSDLRGEKPIYKPNFCVECGERILRARWLPWTSRSFCKYCAPGNTARKLAGSMLLGIALVGAGVLIGRSMREPTPSLILQSTNASLVPIDSVLQKAAAASRVRAEGQPSPSPAESGMTTVAETGPKPDAKSDEIYICGARTKKGSICTRHVHGNVRCFQHKGQPAALPAEQLRVKK